MRLNSAHIDQTQRQLGGRPLSDGDPAMPHLIELFGDHTFFIDEDGLKIVVPEEADEDAAGGDENEVEAVRVVELASWVDDSRSRLLPHEREVTEVVVLLDRRH